METRRRKRGADADDDDGSRSRDGAQHHPAPLGLLQPQPPAGATARSTVSCIFCRWVLVCMPGQGWGQPMSPLH